MKDEAGAAKALDSAINYGFHSPALLENDPAFDELRKKKEFYALVKRSRENGFRIKSNYEILRDEEYNFKKDMPYGAGKMLIAASYLEKSGKTDEAVLILNEIIGKKPRFRDKSAALFWLTRIHAKQGKSIAAKKYLKEFEEHLNSIEADPTGYKDIVSKIYKDVLQSDLNLKELVKSE